MADEPEGHEMRVDSALLRELAELLSSNDLTEIEVQDGNRKIKVRREVAPAAAPAPAAPAPAAAAPALPAVVAAEPAPAAAVDAIKSPMVGTCFLSPEPGAKPFVAVGEKVTVGDTLLIIEAMKVMNPILSTKAGTVRQILVADSQAVEYDQPLVVVE